MTHRIPILIVEDEDDHFELISRNLNNGLDQFLLLRSSSIAEARHVLMERQVRLILTDWILPDGQGIELITNLSDPRLTIPVIVMTSYGNEMRAVEAMKQGARDYIVKSPEIFSDIIHIVERTLKEWNDTIQRFAAEDALLKSEFRFREVIDNIGEGIGLVDVDENFSFTNRSAEIIFGVAPGELTGRNLQEFIDSGKIQQIIEQTTIRRKGERTSYELDIRRPDGGKRTILVTGTSRFDEKGNFEGTFGVFRDITEAKNAEIELRKSEKQFRSLFEKMIEGVTYHDADGKIISLNPAALDLLGLTYEQAIGKAKIPDGWMLRREDGSPFRWEMSNRIDRFAPGSTYPNLLIAIDLPAHSRRWAVVTITPEFREGDIIPYRTFSTLADVTSQKIALEALQKSEALFHSLVESLPQKIYTKDLMGRYTFANRPYCLALGKNRDEVIGKTDADISPAADAEKSVRDDLLVVSKRKTLEFDEEESGEPDDVQFRHVIKSPLYDVIGNVTGILGIFWDITEVRRAAEIQRQSLNEKELLLKEIHHRVKNNMQIISSMLNLQSMEIEDDALRTLFMESQQRIRSMALIHEKLYQTESLSKIDLGEYVRSLGIQLLRFYHHCPVSIHVRIESIECGIDTAIPVGLIINELIVNSLKHAFVGKATGEITISLNEQEDDFWEFYVADNGVGLSKDFSIKKAETLGMQLVDSLVSQLDGTISMTADHGTTWVIRFRPIEREAKRIITGSAKHAASRIGLQ